MFCTECGHKLDGQEEFCPECGRKNEQIKKQDTFSEKLAIKSNKIFFSFKQNIKTNKKKYIKIGIAMVIIGLVILITSLIFNYIHQKKIYYTFKIDDQKYLIGEEVSYYERKGFTYKDNHYDEKSYILADGFVAHNFYKDNENIMYGAMHCEKQYKCNYSDSNLIKINFHRNTKNIIFADFITYGTSYEEIVKRIGKPDGKFYMGDNEYVWSFYKKGKVNNPYFILEFDSSKKVINMKIGLWWYSGEYEHTIKK